MQALTASPLHFERPPSSEFAQISKAERMKFSQKSADDTRFTRPGSQNAILERNAQISDWICQNMPAEILKTSKFCCRHRVQKPPCPPLCFGHTTANHQPTAHSGFILIDQKQTIIQACTSPGKNCQGILHCKFSLNEATYSNCGQSQRNN